MSRIDTPLSDDELDQLGDFLLDRIPEELNDSAGAVDEGILDISELDGFLTALVSGPAVITPSQWLPVVWGDFEPEWPSSQEAEATISLILRHMSGIVNTLMEEPDRFEPIVLQFSDEMGGGTNVEEWCYGYMKGVSLAAREWRDGGGEVAELMVPISLFSSDKGHEHLKKLDVEEVETLKRSLPAAAQQLHAFWLKRRAAANAPFVHDKPPVGRNDPCPCGSGKKFKKCCLH